MITALCAVIMTSVGCNNKNGNIGNEEVNNSTNIEENLNQGQYQMK